MYILDNKEFLKKLNNDYKINNEYVNISKKLVNFEIDKQKFIKQDINKSLEIIKKILLDINKDYLVLFNKMLKEEDEDKPIIYIYNSLEEVNESLTIKNQIHFYKTDTNADIYILLHEFTHYLINSKNRLIFKNKEILPILMEFIISDILNDKTYILDRINDIIFNCKSLLIKNEILNYNFDIDKCIKKYNINDKEKELINLDLLFSKNLNYDEEIAYIKGFIYAYYYSLNSINNYNNLMNDFRFDSINIDEIINQIVNRGDYNEKRSFN